MALITVNLRLVSPQGTSDVPDPATGRVEFVPAAHGKYQNSLRTVERVPSTIDAEGVMVPVELTPDLWKVTITPTKGNPWPEMLFELTEGMPEPVNLADLLPETVVDGAQLAKGDPGPIGPQGEPGPEGPRGPQGEQGTTAWADLTGKPATFPSTVADVDGLGDRLDVLERDTGPRNVAAEIADIDFTESLSYATLRRIGNAVELSLSGTATGTLANGFALWALPSGFRGPRYGLRGVATVNRTLALVESVHSAQSLNVYRAAAEGDRVKLLIQHFTDDPWPTTLPGDPA